MNGFTVSIAYVVESRTSILSWLVTLYQLNYNGPLSCTDNNSHPHPHEKAELIVVARTITMNISFFYGIMNPPSVCLRIRLKEGGYMIVCTYASYMAVFCYGVRGSSLFYWLYALLSPWHLNPIPWGWTLCCICMVIILCPHLIWIVICASLCSELQSERGKVAIRICAIVSLQENVFLGKVESYSSMVNQPVFEKVNPAQSPIMLPKTNLFSFFWIIPGINVLVTYYSVGVYFLCLNMHLWSWLT